MLGEDSSLCFLLSGNYCLLIHSFCFVMGLMSFKLILWLFSTEYSILGTQAKIQILKEILVMKPSHHHVK